eukprot:3499761-Prymnesium_polylepis.2
MFSLAACCAAALALDCQRVELRQDPLWRCSHENAMLQPELLASCSSAPLASSEGLDATRLACCHHSSLCSTS